MSSVEVCSNIEVFFFESLAQAREEQGLFVTDGTLSYLKSLMAGFVRTGDFYPIQNYEGRQVRPLTYCFADALHARSVSERNLHLQRLGDQALFVTGVWANVLERSTVDVDYYISMGRRAYGLLAESVDGSEVYIELEEQFLSCSDLMCAASGTIQDRANADIFRLAERQGRSGSLYLKRLLAQYGVTAPGAALQ